MSLRINNNIQALNGYRNLNKNDHMLGGTLERLSSGLRINKAADDAAGLVISEQLRAQIVGLNRGISNTETAVNMVQTAEGALDEVNTLLKKVRDLSLHASNTAPNDTNQLQADQAELDNAIQSISRIASTTQFGTKKVLDGSLAAANSYDTTKIHKFDVGTALLTRADFTPGTVSLVIDSSAETSTLVMSIAGQSTAVSVLSFNASTALSVEVSDIIGGTTFSDFWADGTSTVVNTASVQMIGRVGETVFSFSIGGATTSQVTSTMNEVQSAYIFSNATGSTNGNLQAWAVSTGAIGAVRDFSLTMRATSGSATGTEYFTQDFDMVSGMGATGGAGSISFGNNQATTIKTSGSATFTGFSVIGGSQGDAGTVFIAANGSVAVGSTMRDTLGDGTIRLNTGAAMTVTVAGKDYSFANNESIADMVSFINNNQSDYKLESDRDYGLTMSRVNIGNGGSANDLRIRITDASGRQSTMAALGATEIEFSTGSGTVPSANDGGIDKGVNITAHLEGTGLPGGRVNLTSNANDASILINNASGVKIDLDTAFAKQAGTVVANLTRGAIFQVGPNNSQLTGVDVKDVGATKLGLGGDQTNALRTLQSLTDKQALVNGLTKEALNVIDKAIDDVTNLRGALGAFQANTLETNLNSLRVTHENLTSAESTIRDTDFAKESATFAKQQILMNASNSMLAQANQLPQSVLQLLGR